MLKKILFSSIILITLSCQKNKPNSIKQMAGYDFYIGTYTDLKSEGIYKYRLNHDGTLQKIGLAAVSDNPSFLAKSSDGQFLLAVNEIQNSDGVGTVSSYAIQGDTLKSLNTSSSGGAHPCYVSINNDGFVLTANYTGGNIGLLQIEEDGKLTQLLDLKQHNGKGVHPRQDKAHAHSAFFTTDQNEIIAVDLGTNQLWFYALDAENTKLTPLKTQPLNMAPGAGPRHLSLYPGKNWIYVLNELDNTISLLKQEKTKNYIIETTVSTLPVDYKQPNTGADIHLSKDGNFLYASNRGHNSIVIFRVDKSNGHLTLIGHESTKGDSPRNFSLSSDDNYLLVANQKSDNIVSFKRDSITGLLTYVDKIEAYTPVCILF